MRRSIWKPGQIHLNVIHKEVLCEPGILLICLQSKKGGRNSEYDQEIPQSQTADNPMAPRGRAAQLLRDTRKTD